MPSTPRKVDLKRSFKRALRGLFSPRRLWRAMRLHRARRRVSRTSSDEGLKLYAEVLRGDFIHFGYFEDPNVDPREISLADLERAQLAYTQLFLDRMHDKARPVLDVGCGMGGLSAQLAARGFVPVALTPDVHQIAYIEQKYPTLELMRGRFEDVDAAANAGRFGTIINSESFQYVDLEKAVKLVTKLLAPGGRWLIGDFFRRSETFRGSGHPWNKFTEVLAANGLAIVYQHDISANAGVTVRFAHMLAEKIGLPGIQYGLGTLARKQPGLHALFGELFDDLAAFAHERTDRLNPENQIRERCYMFVEVARTDEKN
jgi:cyclopropane fatty-acyl-phospholipid synthase-like methyltransferase